jgi:hypothetical protein
MSSRTGGRRLGTALRGVTVRPRPPSEWTLLGVFGVVLTAVVVGLVGGATGAGLAAAFVVVWLLLPAVYSYALGHVLALGTTASALAVVELLFVELGLLAVLFGPLTRPETHNRGSVARSTLGVGFALVGVVVVSLALTGLVWVTALVLVLVGCGLGYGIHRYGLVVLGLVDDSAVADTDGADGAGRVDASEASADDEPPATSADAPSDRGGTST